MQRSQNFYLDEMYFKSHIAHVCMFADYRHGCCVSDSRARQQATAGAGC